MKKEDLMEMECDECGGTGMIECPLEYGGKHPENCPSCGGEQIVICPLCRGTGKLNMELNFRCYFM